LFHNSLSNLYNNVIIYNIKKNRENSFVCERNVQNFPIHVIRALYIDVSLYLTIRIQASSRLKRSANHLWNNSDVCRKKFGEWSPLATHHHAIMLVGNKPECHFDYSCSSFYASISQAWTDKLYVTQNKIDSLIKSMSLWTSITQTELSSLGFLEYWK
jgi:hypothetical protein